MNITVPFVRLAMVALAASFASPLFTANAMAAKEKFERKKPHVNVGTIGNVDQAPGGLAVSQGDESRNPSNPNSSAEEDCQAEATTPSTSC